ncbi:MAG: TIGR04282 family arsenosugar biosynthesis glycosyltransferase, partial [Magnetococcales bacterium]|nr:TIGR04282 family arsenosugar biosynthesis glycosyltransferase [Magnetococcales bacterium]
MDSATRILIFAKAPQPGFAKTRLIPLLGAAAAADLAHRLLNRTLASAIDARLGPVELCVTPPWADPAWQRVTIPAQVQVTTQGEGDLGERMAQAVRRCSGPLLLIGTDCVEMSAELLREAAAALQSVDALLYTTADGGYAVLGLHTFHPSLFADMAWSTATVAEETIDRIHSLGWSLHLGGPLHDVDEPQDWLRSAG